MRRIQRVWGTVPFASAFREFDIDEVSNAKGHGGTGSSAFSVFHDSLIRGCRPNSFYHPIHCGRFEDEDDILVRCQGPNCGLRSVDYELPGLFHGRCAAALDCTRSAHWQNCPWCLLAKHAENFEKFDEPDKKHENDEYVCGKWASEKGESSIFRDCNMNCLSFEELVDDSGYLHGWLDRNRDGWQARLAFHDMDEDPCYSSSCGEEPEYVGDIHVRLLSETAVETQIKFSDDDEWQPPVVLTLQHRDGSNERNLLVPLPELGAGAATVDGVIVPAGCDETSSSELGWYSA